MDIKTLVDKDDLTKYDELLKRSQYAYIFQTIPYLSSLKVLGYGFEIVGIFENNKLMYALPVQKKKILFINKYFYSVPYGIISEGGQTPKVIVDIFLNYLKKTAYIIRFSNNQKIIDKTLNYLGEQTTILIDLENPIDYIFSSFSKTHRNCSRKAKKEGVVVKIENSLEFIEIFIDLYLKLMKNKSVTAINLNFLKDCLLNLLDNNLGFFAVAYYNDVIYNIAFITTIGKHARYLYGASLRVDEKIPPTGQFLHYEIIKYLKLNKFYYYDLGGIPNLPVEENNSAYFVYKFKKGFGGTPTILCYDYYYTKYRILKFLIR